jgi:hypothetical protein
LTSETPLSSEHGNETEGFYKAVHFLTNVTPLSSPGFRYMVLQSGRTYIYLFVFAMIAMNNLKEAKLLNTRFMFISQKLYLFLLWYGHSSSEPYGSTRCHFLSNVRVKKVNLSL